MVAGRTRFGASAVALLMLSGCANGVQQATPLPAAPSETPAATAAASSPVQPVGVPESIATGLDAPWSIVFAGDSALISERDTAQIMERTSSGTIREVGEVSGAVARGEGGLLGLAMYQQGDSSWLYAYYSGASDNRIVRMPLTGKPGFFALGAEELVLGGLEKAGNHNGGRIAVGPDGMLYATVGDAGDTANAQDLASLNGKILRMTPTGAVPSDNPFPGSLVYSLGHRNPQGLAWDADGQLWASEFGQNTWDEVNRIEAGANYGWPVVEGVGNDAGYVDPVYQWTTDEASPSGLAFEDGTLFLAALRGQRMWALYDDGSSVPYLQGQFGRIRDVAVAPDGALWLLTNNTDGRGTPDASDDRIIRVQLAPLGAG